MQSAVFAPTNAMTDEPVLINAHSLVVRPLGGRIGEHATRLVCVRSCSWFLHLFGPTRPVMVAKPAVSPTLPNEK